MNQLGSGNVRPNRWTTLLWIGAFLSLALAVWQFLPGSSGAGRGAARLRVVLVDASASTARARAWLPWVRAELRAQASEARAAREDLAVAAYAEGLVTGFAPGEPARFLEALEGRGGAPFDPGAGLARGATHLAAALEGVEPWLLEAERPGGELVLLGPLTYTGASPTAAFTRLTESGVTLAARAPPRAEESDLGLLELVLAPRVEPGAPLVALARLVLHRGTGPLGTARLALEVDGSGARHERALELALPGVDGEFELPVDCGPAGRGENVLRARIVWDTGPDPWPENDRAEARTLAAGARLVGVAVDMEAKAAAEEWLAPGGHSRLPGLEFAFFAPNELGARLAGLDALVSFDLPLRELTPPLLESFVRRGGGWLALAGWRFLAGWPPAPGEEGGASGTLQGLLPSEPAEAEAPPREVVLLVDGSGSMEGPAFDIVRAAALELVAAALPSDRVSLRFFTQGLEPAHLLRDRPSGRSPDVARDAARELLRLRVPSGTTFLLRSLRELGAAAGTDETLLLLLTDGRDRDEASDERAARSVAAELAASRVRLVVIGVGEVNRGLLAALAGSEGSVHSGESLGDLEAIFRRELLAGRLAEGELELRLAARASGSLADEVASVASSARAPLPIERYVRNRLRKGGEAVWVSAEGEPVLTIARAGLGRTAFFASRPGADWAARHGRGPEAGLDGVLRWLARGPARGAAPRARLESGRLRVTDLLPGTPPELPAKLLGANEGRLHDEPTLLPPDELGIDVQRTREAHVRDEGWSGPLVLCFETGGGEEECVAVERALPDEFAWREHLVPGPLPSAESRPRGARATGSRPLALWAMGLGLALLLAAGVSASTSAHLVSSLRGQGLPRSSR